jgi:hypothetical protein
MTRLVCIEYFPKFYSLFCGNLWIFTNISETNPNWYGFMGELGLTFVCALLWPLWCEGLITPIFKSDDRSDCNNYRGICVLSCLGELFCLILNEWLLKFTKENNSIHPSQIGFLPGHRIADHILTIKTLTDKYVNQKTNGRLYTCFVNFKKAFDSVWHDGLYLKLLKNKISGNFYKLMKNLYSNSKCAVKQSNHRTSFFHITRGYVKDVHWAPCCSIYF